MCLLAEPAGERWMQDVASEMNLSETAFLVRREDDFDLRWFTPTVELALCGHGTLASAHVLWETGEARQDETIQISDEERTSLAAATRRRLDRARLSGDARRVPCDPPPTLAGRARRRAATFVGKSKFDFFVEVPSEREVREVCPDLGALAQTGRARRHRDGPR